MKPSENPKSFPILSKVSIVGFPFPVSISATCRLVIPVMSANFSWVSPSDFLMSRTASGNRRSAATARALNCLRRSRISSRLSFLILGIDYPLPLRLRASRTPIQTLCKLAVARCDTACGIPNCSRSLSRRIVSANSAIASNNLSASSGLLGNTA